ncbi:MAG: ATP-binding protein [Bacteroidia bacterium]
METATKNINGLLNSIKDNHFHDIIETSVVSILNTLKSIDLTKSELITAATISLNELFVFVKNSFSNNSTDFIQKSIIKVELSSLPYISSLIENQQKNILLNYIDAYVKNSDEKIIIYGVIEKFYSLRQTNVTKQFYNHFIEQDTLLRKKEEEIIQIKQEGDQFVYAASHDLQEPLRMINSYLQLLATKYKDKLDTNANEFIDFALDGSGRMKDLINGLLEFSRLNNTSLSKAVNTNTVISSVIKNLSQEIEDTNAVIEYNDLPEIQGDANLFIKLFQHLISNAIKFKSNEAPQINITAKKIDNGYCFAVKDNGIGIQKKYSEKIFTIFQRLHAKHVYPSAGIGLAVCKKIIEKYNGKIWVDSELNEGSTFYFTLY